MKETKPTTVVAPSERESAEKGEISLLDELELVLAAGGNGDVDWP